MDRGSSDTGWQVAPPVERRSMASHTAKASGWANGQGRLSFFGSHTACQRPKRDGVTLGTTPHPGQAAVANKVQLSHNLVSPIRWRNPSAARHWSRR